MASTSPASAGSGSTPIAPLAPIALPGPTVTAGFWADRLRVNREQTLPHGFAQLRRAGNLTNLGLAAGAQGRYKTLGARFGLDFPFLDSDVYKWLEAAAWELGRLDDHDLRRSATEAIALVVAAQRQDGYLNSYVQVAAPGREYQDLAWGHELYCIGHLIEAAIAWHRLLGDDRLLGVAIRATDALDRALGSVAGPPIDGHPEIEMALIELFRTTGQARYLELARTMIERRGHEEIPSARFGSAYWQDHLPVRLASTVAGHAVRQLYLDCGVVDLAVETGDQDLLDAVIRRWRDMVATRSYLTGGLGSRSRDEAFGDPYELPPDQAYAETCAAIASVKLAWRLLLATGSSEFADVIERTIYNAVLPGVALAGTTFFYVNTLQRRTRRTAEPAGHGERATWFPCACCPPNLMRTLSSWPEYLATSDRLGLQIQQYAAAEIEAEVEAGRVRVAMATEYPWQGRVTLTVLSSPAEPWTLSLRIPGWCAAATVQEGADGPARRVTGSRWTSPARTWAAGDRVVLELEMPARVIQPDSRIDAVRGCVAITRGPLVYCLEEADLPAGIELEDIRLDPAAEPALRPLPGTIPGSLAGLALQVGSALAVPYFAWGNRGSGAMRVWIPVSAAERSTP